MAKFIKEKLEGISFDTEMNNFEDLTSRTLIERVKNIYISEPGYKYTVNEPIRLPHIKKVNCINLTMKERL